MFFQQPLQSCYALFGLSDTDLARLFVVDVAEILEPDVTISIALEESTFCPLAIFAFGGVANINEDQFRMICQRLVDEFQGAGCAVACMVNCAKSKLLLCFLHFLYLFSDYFIKKCFVMAVETDDRTGHFFTDFDVEAETVLALVGILVAALLALGVERQRWGHGDEIGNGGACIESLDLSSVSGDI